MCITMAAMGIISAVGSFAIGAAQAVMAGKAADQQYQQQMMQWQMDNMQLQAQNRIDNLRYQQEVAQYREGIANTQHAEADTFASIQARAISEMEATQEGKSQAAKEAMMAASRARTAAGEAGVHGLSVDALLADVYRQKGDAMSSLNANLATSRMNLYNDARTAQAQYASQYNSFMEPIQPIPGIMRAQPTKPSSLSTGLGIASAALSGLSIYNNSKTQIASISSKR